MDSVSVGPRWIRCQWVLDGLMSVGPRWIGYQWMLDGLGVS